MNPKKKCTCPKKKKPRLPRLPGWLIALILIFIGGCNAWGGMEGYYLGEPVTIPAGPTTHETFLFFDNGRVISTKMNSRTVPTAPHDWFTLDNAGKMFRDGNWGGGLGLEYWTMVFDGYYIRLGPIVLCMVQGTNDKDEYNLYIFRGIIDKDGVITATMLWERPISILEGDVRIYRPVDW